MAISAYVGLPGHGKTYGVVENIIIPALDKKRLIFTNIPMRENQVFDRFGINVIQFEVDDIKNDANWWKDTFIDGSLFVLDEVPKLWPAGLKANAMRETDRDFLAEHRHLVGEEGFSTEIILVVQNLTMIAAFPRGLVETTFWVVKHIKMGSNKRYRVDVYSGVMAGQNPQISKREREIQGKFKPEVYSLYHSHTKSKTGAAGNEQRVDSRFNMFKGASIKVGLLSICIFAFFAYVGLSKVAEFYQVDETTQTEQSIQTPEIAKVNKQVKPKKKDLLAKLDEIIFSYSIKERQNGFIKKTNFFKITQGKTESLISDHDLKLLGYKVNEISECLFHLISESFNEFVMCPQKQEDKTFFESLAKADT